MWLFFLLLYIQSSSSFHKQTYSPVNCPLYFHIESKSTYWKVIASIQCVSRYFGSLRAPLLHIPNGFHLRLTWLPLKLSPSTKIGTVRDIARQWADKFETERTCNYFCEDYTHYFGPRNCQLKFYKLPNQYKV